MAISHRAAATGTGTTSVTVTKPTGTVDGDLLFAQVYGRNSGGTAVSAATAPAGWTQIDTLQINAAIAYVRLTTFYKVASGEGASFTFTTTGYTNASAIVSAYAGNWGATPLDVHSAQANGSSTNVSAASVTVSQNNSLAIFSAAQAGANAETPATGYTEPTNGAATNAYRQDLNHNLAVSSGATGIVTATIAAAAINEAFLAVFKEASGTVVAAPVLAGSGLMPAPTPKLTIPIPAMTGSGLLPAPTPKISLTAPVLTGSGLLPAPSLALVSNPTVAAPVLSGSGLLPAPSLVVGIVVAAPVLAGSGGLIAPSPALALAAPVLTGSGGLIAPTPALLIAAPTLSGSGGLLDAALALSTTIQAPVLLGVGALTPSGIRILNWRLIRPSGRIEIAPAAHLVAAVERASAVALTATVETAVAGKADMIARRIDGDAEISGATIALAVEWSDQ